MISLTLYRMLTVTTVLMILMTGTMALDGLLTDLMLSIPIIGGTIVMGALVISMTRHPERLTKTDRTLPWWAVIGIQLVAVGVLSVLIRMVLG